MITLDPDFVGSLAPSTKLTTAVNDTHDIPFARLPRLDRLRAQGKADETEVVSDDDDDDDGDKNGKTLSKAEKEKRKMRGKGKSVKRYFHTRDTVDIAYASKTQIPPEAAQERHRSHRGEPLSLVHFIEYVLMFAHSLNRLLSVQNWRSNGKKSG